MIPTQVIDSILLLFLALITHQKQRTFAGNPKKVKSGVEEKYEMGDRKNFKTKSILLGFSDHQDPTAKNKNQSFVKSNLPL